MKIASAERCGLNVDAVSTCVSEDEGAGAAGVVYLVNGDRVVAGQSIDGTSSSTGGLDPNRVGSCRRRQDLRRVDNKGRHETGREEKEEPGLTLGNIRANRRHVNWLWSAPHQTHGSIPQGFWRVRNDPRRVIGAGANQRICLWIPCD